MFRSRTCTALVAAAALVTACGNTSSTSTTTHPVVTTVPATTVPATTVPVTTLPATTVPVTTAPVTNPPTTVVAQQPSIWPADGVVFTTPEAAAKDFLLQVFGDGPMIGAFRGGDARSGEFDVFASAEGKPLTAVRSTLLMRQLGPSDGWFVLAAVSAAATITTPVSGSSVSAGPLVVTGAASGFEANIGLRAFVAGHADQQLDQQTTLAGNFGTPKPYSVTLDLSAATPGSLVSVVVHGGAGLETDPGDFSAIPVLIAT